jgi:ubiquinol-cytochrome c reductase cytochrome b subunit
MEGAVAWSSTDGSPTISTSRRRRPQTLAGKSALWVDERFKIATPTRRFLNKVYPDNWSYMLGEIALYSFVILILTGTYLSFFFDPSMGDVRYDGSYVPLKGVEMSRAYASTLHISFDVRGGLVIRQIHHWAALLFVAAIVVHMLRIFFTGAFRKPREVNWLIGMTLLLLGVLEGFVGYSMPDDLLSGTGLRIADAIMLSVPIIGTWISFLVFGGEFPGTEIIFRFYIVHVLLIPGILAVLIAAHLAIMFRQKHTDFPGPGKTEQTVSGSRFLPTFAAKTTGLFFIIFGLLAALGGLAQINPVWLYGPYNPAQVSSGSQPDWYMGVPEGAMRLFPSWETRLWGHTVPATFWPAVVVPSLMLGLAFVYPFLEAKLTRDRVRHNLLQRPRDVPVRTSLGAMALAFTLVLFISGGNDLIAHAFDISLNAMTWGGRIALLVLPPLAYVATYRACLGLQRHDREVLEHGVETGIIKRLPTGEFIEVHQPLGPVDEHGHGTLTYAAAAVPKRMNRLGSGPLSRVRGFFYPVKERAEIQAALDELERTERAQLTGSDQQPRS